MSGSSPITELSGSGPYPRAGRLRRFAFKTSALLLGMIVATCLVELILRVVAPQPMSFGRFYALDETLPWTLLPNHHEQITTGEYSVQIHINPLGCRAIGVSPTGKNDTTVLVLGDSFMFGNGVEDGDTMAAQLQAILRRAGGSASNCGVVNAGVPGFGPVQYKIRYEQLRARLRPAIVIVGLYLGNDIFDCVWDKSAVTVVDGYLVSKERANASVARFWMKRNLHLYRLASRVSQSLRASGAKDSSYRQTLATLFVDRMSDPDALANRAWPAFEQVSKRLLDDIRADGATPLVVILPIKFQVDDTMWQRFVARIATDKRNAHRFLPQERVAQMLERLGVSYVDLTPAFMARGAADLFYALDGHWTPRGHKLAAKIVFEKAKKMVVQCTLKRG